MSFFSNDAINRVNIHAGVQALANGAGGVFVLVFLLRAGVPTPLVFLTMSAMTLGRFVLRPMVLPIARRIGLRRTLVLGTVLEAAIFPILPQVHGPGLAWAAAIVVGAVGSVLYWTTYHAYFASLGDAEHRGAQIGAREALMQMVNIVAPAIGGWALASAGPQAAFWGVAVVQAAAALPLIGLPEVGVAHEAPGGFRAAALGAALLATDGWFAACSYYVWQIVLFVSLGEHFAAYGGAMAVAGVLSAAATLGIGRLIDLGHGVRSVLAAYGFAAAVIALKAAGYTTPWLAVAANALGAMSGSLLIPTLMTRVYNLAKVSPCPLRFHIATEAGWDTGCALGCAVAALLTWAGLPFGAPILLGLLGAAAACVMLLGSYGRLAAEAEA